MITLFKGTGVAMITPFKDDNTIDYDSLQRIIEHLIQGAVDYIVVNGTTAESVNLSAKERKEVLNFSIKEIAGRVPVMYGIGGNNTREVVETIKSTDFSHIQGVLSVAPYYNKPNQEGIYQHFTTISEACPVEVILYNVPGRTGVNILPQTVVRIAERCDNIRAIKEASGSIEQIMKLIMIKQKDFTVISGDDALTLALIAVGAEGVISVAANAFPKIISDIVKETTKYNLCDANKLHYKILESISLMFEEGNPTGIKEYMSQLGIIKNNLRLPLIKASASLSEKIRQNLMYINVKN